ncbi:MAG: lipopolysaccharide biosynthesis protein [Steroidobacteraceae bacterium]
MSGNDLDRSLVSGIGWTALARWSSQAISWVAILYAARFLQPSDYGLVGLAMLPIGLVRLIEDFGFDAVLVQNRKLSRDDIARLGGLTLVIASCLTGLMLLAAPTLGELLAKPGDPMHALLPTVIAIASAMIILDALQVVPRALLQRELRFKALAGIHLAQVAVTSLVLVAIARNGGGYWALILNNLSGASVATVLLFVMSPILLRWPSGLARLKHSLLQGWRMLVSRSSWYAYSNADSTAIGRFLGTDALGNYQFAQTFSNTAVQEVTALITRVVPGVFSSAQSDPAALRRYFLLLTEALAYVAFPMCAGVALTADVLVLAALGPTWTGVIDPLRALCLYSALVVAQILVSHVLLWTGRFRANMWLSMLALLVLPTAAYVGAQYDVTTVAWALALGFPIASFPGVILARRAIALPWKDYGQALFPATLACGVMAISVLAVRATMTADWQPLPALAIQSAAGAVTYVAVLGLRYRDRLRVLYRLVRHQQTS